MVSIPACHAGDRGSIPRRGAVFYSQVLLIVKMQKMAEQHQEYSADENISITNYLIDLL